MTNSAKIYFICTRAAIRLRDFKWQPNDNGIHTPNVVIYNYHTCYYTLKRYLISPIQVAMFFPGSGFMAVVIALTIVKSTILL